MEHLDVVFFGVNVICMFLSFGQLRNRQRHISLSRIFKLVSKYRAHNRMEKPVIALRVLNSLLCTYKSFKVYFPRTVETVFLGVLEFETEFGAYY
jgi:hypothetical protein